MSRITPNWITVLEKDEIFVFGSNLKGLHAGGAARLAMNRWGAVTEVAEGFRGQTYAIPTLEGPGGGKLPLPEIKEYVDRFIQFASAHPEMKFLVTEIGCGIAGFSAEEIGPLFSAAKKIENIWLPGRFL